jgi:hypothetical protein
MLSPATPEEKALFLSEPCSLGLRYWSVKGDTLRGPYAQSYALGPSAWDRAVHTSTCVRGGVRGDQACRSQACSCGLYAVDPHAVNALFQPYIDLDNGHVSNPIVRGGTIIGAVAMQGNLVNGYDSGVRIADRAMIIGLLLLHVRNEGVGGWNQRRRSKRRAKRVSERYDVPVYETMQALIAGASDHPVVHRDTPHLTASQLAEVTA